MKRRKRVNKRKDKRIFNQTANKTKTINLMPMAARGGRRL